MILWLAPAVLASMICSVAWHLLSGGGVADLSSAFGFGLITLLFTIGGSAFLTLMFARMRSTPNALRYVALVALGCVAGVVPMLWATSDFRIAGAIYGTTTACIWCAAHLLLYRSDVR